MSKERACLVSLLLGDNAGSCSLIVHLSKVEPALETAHAGEDVWQEEVEQTPKLAQVVLEWRPCKKSKTSV